MTQVTSAPGPHVLVTGASGLLGPAVIRLLASKGFRVRILARSGATFDPGIEAVAGDMTDAASLLVATKDIDWIIHLAARKSDEADSEAVNVGGARNLADAAKANRVELIVNVSTQSVKLKRKGLYARTKSEADTILMNAGVPTVTLMPSVIYSDLEHGIFGSLMRFLKLPVVPVIGGGHGILRPIHRQDVAEIILRIAENPGAFGKTFDIGGPDEVSMNRLIALLERKTGKKKMKIHIPIAVAMLIAKILKVLGRPIITESNVLGAAEDVPMDIRPITDATGFTARNLAEGLELQRVTSEEAKAILAYILKPSGNTPTNAMIALYERALKANRVPAHTFDTSLLGPIDAASRLFFPQCILQSKMLTAAAVIECDPASAEWLLPKERGVAALIGLMIACALIGIWKLLLGSLLLILRPSFFRRNAGV